MQWLLVGCGAAIGGMLRLLLTQLFNAIHPWLPLGTLAANVLGGFLMGLVLAFSDGLSPQVRLFLATGILGGLTTFSTFSAESFGLLNAGKFASAFILISIHVVGSILATFVGFYLVNSARG